MAINKRKILESAQKHLQKGALDKALKDYETLLRADPKDANVRLKIGDLQLKRGKSDEAIAAYLKVADAFMRDGFDAKAVALYKQITKIDDKRVDVFVPLAELYERMGLQSDAMKALQAAADVHYREGQKDKALDLLRRMANLDPANTQNRIKVADLLRQEERNEEAIAEYEAAAEELERQGAEEDRVRVLARVLEIDPHRIDVLLAVGRSRIEAGSLEAAAKAARLVIDRHPDEVEAWTLLGEALDALGRTEERVQAYRRAAEIHRERGNEELARDITQRFVAPAGLEDEPSAEEENDLLLGDAVEDLGGVDPEESDPGFDPNAMNLGSPIDAREHETIQAALVDEDMAPLPPLRDMVPGGSAAEEGAGGADAPVRVDGDPEQLLAEASVYMRYGKHERAIESLRAIVACAPEHALAHGKLGEALQALGENAEAIEAFERGAVAARDSGEMLAFASLRTRLEALDPERARRLAALPSDAPSGESDVEVEIDIDGEIEIDPGIDAREEATAEEVVGDAPLPAVDVEVSAASAPAEPEGDGEQTGLREASLELVDVVESAPPAPGADLMDDGLPGEDATLGGSGLAGVDVEIDVDIDAGIEGPEEEPSDEAVAPVHAVEIEAPDAGASATTPAQVAEELEEADFFFQQGMLPEAREVYERILANAPNHPHAMLRIGEIDAAEARSGSEPDLEPELLAGVDPGRAAEAPSSSARAAERIDAAEEREDELAADAGVDLAAEALFGAEAPELPCTVQDAGAEVVEPGDAAADEDEETGELAVGPPPGAPVQAEVTAPVVETPWAADGDDAGGDFDLVAELSEVFDVPEPAEGLGLAGGTEEEGFEQVFAAFKQGVENALSDTDFEARYDLGIAYREMGLLDDAIQEFGAAMGAEARRLPCLHMMGLCALDLGRGVDAVAHLEQALALPELPTDQRVALRFDLGRAYVAVGDVERARSAFEEVQAEDPDFQGVGDLLAGLEQPGSGEGPEAAAQLEPAEAFENFDEFMLDDSGLSDAPAEASDEAEARPPVAHDSEDATARLEETVLPPAAAGGSEEAVPDPADAAQPVPSDREEASASPEPGGRRPGRRRKKISFV